MNREWINQSNNQSINQMNKQPIKKESVQWRAEENVHGEEAEVAAVDALEEQHRLGPVVDL